MNNKDNANVCFPKFLLRIDFVLVKQIKLFSINLFSMEWFESKVEHRLRNTNMQFLFSEAINFD
jgi:hypothetical protein